MMNDATPELNLDPEQKSGQTQDDQIFDYWWFKLEVDAKEGIIRKSYKTDGILNGDVLEQKYNCCAIFTTDKGMLVITICKKTMKIAAKTESKFYDIYGEETSEAAFTEDWVNCGPPVDPLATSLEITPIKGAIVIPNMSSIPALKNVVTTIKDGQIIMDDGKTKVVENLAAMQTLITKPGEKVTLMPNKDMTINERIVDENGNVISDHNLDQNDQAMVLDQSALDQINAINASKPPIMMGPDGKPIPNPPNRPNYPNIPNIPNAQINNIPSTPRVPEQLDPAVLASLTPAQQQALRENLSQDPNNPQQPPGSPSNQFPPWITPVPGAPLQPGMPG